MHILDPAPLLDNFHHKQLEEVHTHKLPIGVLDGFHRLLLAEMVDPRQTTPQQRRELPQCLHRILEERSKKSSELYLSTPSSVRSHATPRRDIDDRPAEFSMFESKRVREYPSGAP